MAVFLTYLLSVCLLIWSSMKGYGVEGRQAAESHQTHTIQLSSLLPSSVCNPSTKANEGKSSLKVVHKHGPCFQTNGDKPQFPSLKEILFQDQSRVKFIHSRLSKNFSGGGDVKETEAATLPVNSGRILGTGNYIVTVGLGSPKKDLSLEFDTGSSLTWTQCEPCEVYCYQQKDQLFDPSMSTTYGYVSCSSASCNSLASATLNPPRCSASSTCIYTASYGDESFSIGSLSTETLSLTASDVFPNFVFGCGQNNEGLFGRSAGLLGLARDPLSLVSQTAQKYDKLFSYCLPSTSSSTGYLTFGNSGALPNSVKFTPLSTISQRTSLYGLGITAISVGGQLLSIPSSVFSKAGAIIDSGTVITRLPMTAYSALRSAFRQMMTMYPPASALAIFDTCYDLSNRNNVSVPPISFSFDGGVVVSLNKIGILVGDSPSQMCLAFAGNSDDSDVAIFGNLQQQTLEVVYDVAGERVGFAPGGCN